MTQEPGIVQDRLLSLEREVRHLRTLTQSLGSLGGARVTTVVGVLDPAHGGTGVTGSILGSVTYWQNASGAQRDQGTVVVENGDRTFDVTTVVGDRLVIGVLDDTGIIVGALGRVRHSGYQAVVNVQGAVVAGDYLRTSATAGRAESAGAAKVSGMFGIALTAFAGPGAGTVTAFLFGGDVGHAAVTLAADAATLFGLTGQELSLDVQAQNLVLAGPASGADADPTFRALVTDDIPTAAIRTTYAARPAAGVSGRLWVPTDSPIAAFDDGADWQEYFGSLPLVTPVNGDFAWVNQGSATVDTTYGGIHLHDPTVDSSLNYRIRKKAAPSAPYAIKMLLIPKVYPENFQQLCIGWRDSSDGKMVVLRFLYNVGWQMTFTTVNSPTSDSGNYTTLSNMALPPYIFLGIEDDNTLMIPSYSFDGIHFEKVHFVSRTDFLATPDEVLFAVNSRSTQPCGMTVVSWEEVTSLIYT